MIYRLLISTCLAGVSICAMAQVNYDINEGKVFTSLEEALKVSDRVYHLDLSGQGLSSFPEEILTLKNLTTLTLKDNKLKSLSGADLKTLKKLRGMDLSQNKFTRVPEEVLELTNLQHLNLGFNSIKKVGQELNRMKYLVELHLAYTQMSVFPVDLQLKYLEVLRLDGNHIEEIHEEALVGLPGLISLNLNNNKLTELTDAVYSSKIERLNLGGNKIVGLKKLGEMKAMTELIVDWNPLTPEDLQRIGSLDKLETLSMENCGVKAVPKVFSDLDRLEEWSLVGNEITDVPTWITEMKSLKKLWLTGNPISPASTRRLNDHKTKTMVKF